MVRSRFIFAVAFLLLASAFQLSAQPQWTQIGPAGGYSCSLASDPATGTIYSSTIGKAYSSTDNGNTWQAVWPASLTESELYTKVIYAGGRLYAFSAGHGFHELRDTGVVRVTTESDCRYVPDQALVHNGQIFATTTARGIYRYTQDVSDCQKISPDGVAVIKLAQAGDALMLCGTNGAKRSTDNGDTWQPFGPQDGTAATFVTNDTFSLISASDIFGERVLYRTLDNGVTWDTLVMPFELYYPAQAMANVGDTVYIYNYGYQGDYGLYRSTNHGGTWDLLHAAGLLPVFNFIQEENGTLFAGSGGGIYRLNVGNGRLEPAYDGWNESTVLSLRQFGNMRLVAGTDAGLYTSTDAGRTWLLETDGIPPASVSWMDAHGDTMAAITLGASGVYYSTNAGQTWSGPHTPNSIINFSRVVFADTVLLAGQNDTYNLIRSTDAGQTWQEGTLPMPYTAAVVYIPQTGQVLLNTKNSLYRSTDLGLTWAKGPAMNGSKVNSMAYIGNALYAATDTGVIKSATMGASWVSASYGIPASIQVTAITNAGDTLYATTNGFAIGPPEPQYGLYRSVNGGTTWAPVDGLRDIPITGFAHMDEGLYVGTGNRGVLRNPPFPVTDAPHAPTNRETLQAALSPNPTTGGATLAYTLPERAPVQIELYNATGEYIRTLMQEPQEAGKYALPIDIGNQPAGLYLVRIRAGNREALQELALVR